MCDFKCSFQLLFVRYITKGGTQRPTNNQPCNGRTYVIRLSAVTEIIHSAPHSGRLALNFLYIPSVNTERKQKSNTHGILPLRLWRQKPLHLQRLPTPVAYVSENVSHRMSHSARSRDKAGMTNVFCRCVSEFTLTNKRNTRVEIQYHLHSQQMKVVLFLSNTWHDVKNPKKNWTSTQLSTSWNSNI